MVCDCRNYDYDCKDCTDAWELSRLYGCRESPKPVFYLDMEVDVGDCVEANQGGERFWLEVTAVCGCYVVGILISDLHFDHPFQKGDCLKILTQQIYNVDRGCEKVLN